MLIKTTHAPRWARVSMLFIPAIWLGLIIGISFLEAPLKFTAPGITIPLGLGIGRRVFLAMNIVEVVLGVFLLVALFALWRNHRYQELPNFNKMRWSLLTIVVLLVKTVVIRPLLAVHTDRVLAGTFEGGSTTHYYYIGVEFLLVIALVALMIVAMRGLLPPTANIAGVAPDDDVAADE